MLKINTYKPRSIYTCRLHLIKLAFTIRIIFIKLHSYFIILDALKNLMTILLLFILLWINSICSGQNLVTNPSFENYSLCPTGPGQIQNVIGWYTFRESPDYFNSCASMASFYSVPNNGFGFQEAASGDGYVGIICYNNSILSREIIADSLSAPLSVGQKYFVSFKLNKPNDNSLAGYSIDGMGVKLSTTKHTNINIDNAPHYYTDSIISDTVKWITVKGSFIADSAYQYLMIGNFFDDANTITLNNGSGPYAYYLVDDVCLSTDSILCSNFSVSVKQEKQNTRLSFYPNPATNKITIINNFQYSYSIEIYNTLGQIEYSKKEINSDNKQIDISSCASGLLFIKIESNNNTFTYKLLKK